MVSLTFLFGASRDARQTEFQEITAHCIRYTRINWREKEAKGWVSEAEKPLEWMGTQAAPGCATYILFPPFPIPQPFNKGEVPSGVNLEEIFAFFALSADEAFKMYTYVLIREYTRYIQYLFEKAQHEVKDYK